LAARMNCKNDYEIGREQEKKEVFHFHSPKRPVIPSK
jgi:hypothetical protein